MRADLPDIFWVRQHLDGPVVEEPASRTHDALAALDLRARVEPGQTVAVGIGSRGIADIASVARATIDHLRGLGLEPFIVPAMGSHGAGDAAGQAQVLSGYGITEGSMGCPVRSQMDTTVIGDARPDGGPSFPVHTDQLAATADHVVVVNRIKPHTHLDGDVESGLCKMLLIGLGKRDGAETFHRATFDHAWPDIVRAAMPIMTEALSVLAGVGIVENDQDRTARIEAIAGTDLVHAEPALLAEARQLLPRVPFDDFDIVLVDQIGKDISGAGWDTNTLGRKHSLHDADPDQRPRVSTVIVRGLTPGTHGNAMGVGLAELCRTRVVDEMDRDATWVNARASGDLAAGMIPIHYPTDRALLEACITRTGLRTLATARLAWIRNTLDLGIVACSSAFFDEAVRRDDLEVLTGLQPLPLDDNGDLPDLLPSSPAGEPGS